MHDANFDAAALLADLHDDQLLAVQEAAENRLQQSALAAHREGVLIDLLEARERTRRKGEIFDTALYVEISDRSAYRVAGSTSMYDLYAEGLRLGVGEARRRSSSAKAVGRFTSMTGERLQPRLVETAAALAAGQIGREHVTVIEQVMDRIPSSVSHEDRVRAEASLAEAARRLDPQGVITVGNRLLAYLDPDGALTDDRERKRQRMFVLQPQDRQLMSKVRAMLTPALRADLEVVLTQWAAPGMNNPDDPDSPSGAADQPGLDPTRLAAAAARDDRLFGQRQHDALRALCRWAMALAGQPAPERIPSQVVITVSDEDLARQSGVALTATGTRLPVTDLVEYAAHAVPYLEVFAGATSQVLYLGRGNRFASLAQRLALFGRDRGCTGPGCTVPFHRTEIHHMPDWAEGGVTDIDHLGGACGRHNRWSGRHRGQWENTVLPAQSAAGAAATDAGRVGWRPAGREGPWQINPVFHPEKLAPHHQVPGAHNRLDESDDDGLAEPTTRPLERPRPSPLRIVDLTDIPPPDPDQDASAHESGAEAILDLLLTA